MSISDMLTDYVEVYATYIETDELYKFKNGRLLSEQSAIKYITSLWFNPARIYERLALEGTTKKTCECPPLLYPDGTYRSGTFAIYFHERQSLKQFRALREVGIQHWLYQRLRPLKLL